MDYKLIKEGWNLVKTRYAAVKTAIGVKLEPFWGPVRSKLEPLNAKYLKKSEPVRQWHRALAQKKPILASIILWTYDITRTGFIVFFSLVFFSWIGLFGRMPSSSELRNIENANTTEIYSADTVLIGKYYIENRTEIGLANISPYVVTALLAVEDKRFFEHSGIDIRSWLRVFKGLATNTSGLGGGSTLSQQLAKNLYPRRNYWIPGVSLLINKIRENIISIKLEGIYDKEELLALYLNTVPFGGDRFGITVAAKYFYNKKAKDLNPAEAATLIGMLKATTALDPTRNPNNSRKRRNLVLARMVDNSDFVFHTTDLETVSSLIANGKLSKEEYEKIKDKPVNAGRFTADEDSGGKGAYFKEYLRVTVMPGILGKLTKEDGTKYNLYRDGLKIYTTLDSRMQNFAEAAVQKHMSALQARFNAHWKGYKESLPWGDDKWLEEQKVKSARYLKLKENEVPDSTIDRIFNEPVKMTVFSWKNGGSDADTLMTPMDSIKHYFLMLNTGFMAMDHSNGHIKAWVGGTSFKYFKYDHILSKRQVGSTFKPIVYAAAVQDSVKPCDYYRNERVTLEDWSPGNSDGTYGGWATVIGGLTYSINTIAAQLIVKVGIQKSIDLATKMGITTKLPREFGIALGAADIMLYDMMKVYGTIANKGTRPEPVTILKIVDRNNKVIYDYQEELRKNPLLGPNVKALSEDEAAIVKRMMQSVVDQGTGSKFRNAYGVVGEFAGKTGTTQNQSDGWFIAFNPTLVTGSWVGGPSPAVRFRDMDLGQGSAMALPIVGEFWKQVRNDKKWRKLTDTRFEENETAKSMIGCPFRIYISPDTLEMLMQDSTVRDSILKNGYRGLDEIVKQRYGSGPEGEFAEPLEGGEILEGIPAEDIQPIDAEEDQKESATKKKDEKKAVEKKTGPDPKAVPVDKKKAEVKKPESPKKGEPKKPGGG
ncbi:MAG: transglycosylase domain-containing protein [Saprospiraceae bacterium]|nr:transglycosylase domain-containing protein [Saprospiraceae bacterium]